MNDLTEEQIRTELALILDRRSADTRLSTMGAAQMTLMKAVGISQTQCEMVGMFPPGQKNTEAKTRQLTKILLSGAS